MFECREDSVLEELLQVLKLEIIEENIFRGQSQDLGFGNVFGGQVLGQALSAVYRTVSRERSVHSLHAYFLRPGNAHKPIVYNVDCIRDGKSFTTRRVIAIQNGRAIFNMAASFQIDESGFEHQAAAPTPPGPEGIMSAHELALKVADQIPEPIREKMLCRKAIEIRPVDPVNPFAPDKREPVRYVWFKAIGRLPDDPVVHQSMLAYASDYGLVLTALYPHGKSFWQPRMQVASLDHAMWFHRAFRMDDWLLYAMESPNAGKARGFASGRIFTRDGKLIASVVQEGLIRFHP
ncbi:MAG: acyl-CoA thioesterase II [Desulfobacteraceae bacterium]